MKKLTCIIMALLLVFGMTACSSTTNSPETTEALVETKPYELIGGYEDISALPEYNSELVRQMQNDYDNNEAAADNKYLGKKYKIFNAVVEEIPTDSQIKITVAGSLKEKTCYMHEDQDKNVILALNKGDVVHLIGRLEFGPLPPEYGIQFTFDNCFIVSEEELQPDTQ